MFCITKYMPIIVGINVKVSVCKLTSTYVLLKKYFVQPPSGPPLNIVFGLPKYSLNTAPAIFEYFVQHPLLFCV